MRRRGRCAQDVEYQRPVLLPLLFPAASTHKTRGCVRPVPRTDSSRTPSLSSTTLSAPAFGRTFNSTYLCRSLLMRRFNPLCALLVRCVVVAGVRRMSNTSAQYCYRCCFPQQVRMKRAAASGQFHAPIRCVVVAVVRRMSNTSARYCYRCCPLPRTPGHRVS